MPIVLSLLCTGAYLHGVGNCPDVEWSSSGARRLVLVQMHHSSTVDQIYYLGPQLCVSSSPFMRALGCVCLCARACVCACVRARARTYHTAASYQNRSNWVLSVITGADVT